MGTLTLLLLAMLCVLGAVVAAVLVVRAQNARRDHMVAMIEGRSAAYASAVNENGPKDAGITQRTISAKLKKAAREQRAARDTKSLTSLIMQAGWSFPPAVYWAVSLTFGIVMFFVLWYSPLSHLAAIALGFFFTFGFPRFVLKWKGARRQKRFLADFADALDGMMRLMKSGTPVTEAMAMVSREFSGPVAEEMGRVYHAQKLGTPMAEAVRKMVPRMPLPEVQMFATAVAIQIQTGSSLSEVLGNLSGVIRARYRLKRKVLALSAEAKISAMIIAALPVVVSLGLWAVKPDYVGLLFTNGTGKMLLTGAVVWMGIGVLTMRQMINFKV